MREGRDQTVLPCLIATRFLTVHFTTCLVVCRASATPFMSPESFHNDILKLSFYRSIDNR